MRTALCIPLAALALGSFSLSTARADDRQTGFLSHDTCDYVLEDGSYAIVYEVEITAGYSYTVNLRSSQFDAFMWIQHPGEIDLNDALLSDDDSAGGTDATISFEADGSGVIWIVVNSYAGGETGGYELELLEY